MTIKRLLLFLVVVVLFAVSAACMTEGVGRRGGLKPDVIQSFPPEVQAAYEVFEHKCSRCHTLGRPLNAPIYEMEHWEAYVARMRRQPGSGISEADGRTILVFLKYYAEKKKRDKAEGREELETTTTSVAWEGGVR